MYIGRPSIEIVIKTNFLTFPHGPHLLMMILEGLHEYVCEHDELLAQVVAVEISLIHRRVPIQDRAPTVVNIMFIFHYNPITREPESHSINMFFEGDDFDETACKGKIHREFLDSNVPNMAHIAEAVLNG